MTVIVLDTLNEHVAEFSIVTYVVVDNLKWVEYRRLGIRKSNLWIQSDFHGLVHAR